MIEAEAHAEEDLSSALCALGASGVEVEGGPQPGGGRVRLRLFFEDGGDSPGEARIREVLMESPAAHARLDGVERVPDGRWVERYVASLAPFDVGRRFTVIPLADPDSPGRRLEPRAGRLALRITPGRAFGTGEHATTRLCLEALEEEVRPGRAFLDVGTGSGILAIGAALLGAAPVTGVDVDPEAVRIARANATLSPAGASIRLHAGGPDAVRGDRFDLVAANLNGAVLAELHRALLALLAPGGRLILSGLLDDEAEGIASALEALGAARVRVVRSGGWACTVHEAARE